MVITLFDPLCQWTDRQHNNLAHRVTSATSREQGEWMSPNQPNTNQCIGSIRPCTRSESRCAKEGNTNLESVKLIQQEAEVELRKVLDYIYHYQSIKFVFPTCINEF